MNRSSYITAMETFDVAIVGAGHNGLACAALLAKNGLSVGVFERRPVLGGAAVSELDVWPGYTISSASYVCSLLDPWLIETLDLPAHGYHAYRKDPASFTALADGRSLLLGSDAASNRREISAFDPDDVEGHATFDAVAADLGRRLFDTFADDDPRFDRFDVATQRILQGSVAELVEQYVRTPVLQAMLANDGMVGTYLGPRDAGTAFVLAYHCAGRALGIQGAWAYVRGGMGAISNALADVARANGARIYSDTTVDRVLTYDGRAIGIVLDDGREIAARVVASNAHPRTTLLDLVDRSVLDPACIAKLQKWKTIGPSLKLNLALGELPNFTARPSREPGPHHHATIHIAPDLDFLQKAYEDARHRGESDDPMLECFLQTPTDTTLAPPGKHILSIFAQYFPYDRPDGWSHATKERAADKIVASLARFAPNVPNAIEARQILTAPDLESRFGLIGGHIFHGELLPGQIYEDRFATRTPVPNLYLCGSGTHPGGCVSGFPGRRAAAAILQDLEVRV